MQAATSFARMPDGKKGGGDAGRCDEGRCDGERGELCIPLLSQARPGFPEQRETAWNSLVQAAAAAFETAWFRYWWGEAPRVRRNMAAKALGLR